MFGTYIDNDLEIKILEKHHASEIFNLVNVSRQSLRTWLTWVDTTNSKDAVEKYIENSLMQFAYNNGFHVGLWYQGQFAGCIYHHWINWQNKSTMLAGWLGEPFCRKKIMLKAVATVVSHAFDTYKLHRVEIRCATGNHRSLSIPKGLGFKEEGIVRGAELLSEGKFVDHVVYGMLSSEWKNPIFKKTEFTI